MSYIVMVYGSLKRGFYNNSLFPTGSSYLGKVKSEPGYTMISFGPYPGVIPVGDGVIHGELWQVPDMRALDRLESNGRLFTRCERIFEDVNGVEYTAWVYLLPRNHPLTRVIADGNWKASQQRLSGD